MTSGITALIATFVLVFGRAIQQQNVVGGHYIAAAMTPFVIAAGEIAVIGVVVMDGWNSWPWIGAGGGFGAVTAMAGHRLVLRKHAAFQRRKKNEWMKVPPR